jgi:hypothetical protein
MKTLFNKQKDFKKKENCKRIQMKILAKLIYKVVIGIKDTKLRIIYKFKHHQKKR